MAGVDDGAGAEEEQRLEERVRGEVIHRGSRARQADGHDHVAELRKRGVGEDAFDVVLLNGHQCGDERGESANPRNDVESAPAVEEAEELRPDGVRAEEEEHAAEHVNAGGDHRRSMDERADGGRAFHRVRQPDVEREHRALAHRAAEDQEAGHRRHAAPGFGSLEQTLLKFIEADRTERRPDEDDAEDESEVAETIRDERFLAGIGRGRLLIPEADEQIAGNTDELPEDEGHHQVVCEHDAEHREHEEAEAAEVAAHAAVFLHVAIGVDVNHRADAGHDEEHQQAERVEAQAKFNLQVANRKPVQ